MAHRGVQLPVHQNWSCHNCGGCCREHQIIITDAEKKRLDQQNWTAEDGVPTDRPLIVRHGTQWRLNHQADGACVFLDGQGLCRIHARFGEPAKPLACQTYPYAIHPAGAAVTTSLRFSCPSVVQNMGPSVASQRMFVEKLAKQIVPASYQSPAAPELRPGHKLEWADFMKLQAYLERGLSDGTVGFTTRLLRVLSWLDLLEQAQGEVLSGDRLGELLAVLHEASVRAQPDDDLPLIRPVRIGRILFRQLVAQLLRHDTELTVQSGLYGRIQLLINGLRFTAGLGAIPTQDDPRSVQTAFGKRIQPLKTVRFSDLEQSFRGRNPEFHELMTRYFRVRIQGIHFCGAAYYDMSVIEGFRALALMYPAVLWVARLRAAQVGRMELQLADVQAALAILDHNSGYSPVLGSRSSRRRLSQLAKLQQITALCGWYSQ
ncbi:MAG: YkgJ family cysteine cluster protein [Planctomycetota bacterium]